MKITSDGQVTIPEGIREQLGLLPNTEVLLDVENDAIRIRKVPADQPTRGQRLVAHMRGRLPQGQRSTDALMEFTRGPYDDLERVE